MADSIPVEDRNPTASRPVVGVPEPAPSAPLAEAPSAPLAAPVPAPIAPPAVPAVQITNVVQGPTVVVANQQSGPGFLTRAVWFVFIGSWLSLLWIIAAWALVFSILGIPLGVAMLNRIPKILTLKPTRRVLAVTTNGNVVTVMQTAVPQLPFLARAVYFCLVGFWLSFFWLLAAWALSLTVVLLPVALLMFDKSPAIVSLRRQ